jgi:hypothetical protein
MMVVSLLAWPTSVYLWHGLRGETLSGTRLAGALLCLVTAAALCGLTFWLPMKNGIRVLEDLG